MERQKVIIDCDAGTDDAVALAMLVSARKYKKVEILAITCVDGNTSVDNVARNVLRTLSSCDALDIPVYKGASSPLLSTTDNAKFAKLNVYHGKDGFGDVYEDDIDLGLLKNEHAVNALKRIVDENRDEVTMLCLGPLTNVALAVKMYPDFVGSVKKFIVMGGNYAGVGNITSHAEFNFYCDPESVHIVMESAAKKLWLLTWEACLKAKIDMEWRNQILGKIDTPLARFFNKIDDAVNNLQKIQPQDYIPCDAYAAGVFLRPDIISDMAINHVDIELGGLKTRGQTLVDHMKFNEPNAYVIKDVDVKVFKELLVFAVDPSIENSRVFL